MKKLLIIATNWPAPRYSASGVRLMQLVDFFKSQRYMITIASTADVSNVNASDFQGISLVSITLNHGSFDVSIGELNPDVVLFDRFMAEEQFGWRVAEHVPNALRILDTEDLHSLRKSREQALKTGNPWNVEIWLKNDMTKREVASIYRCDLLLIISSYEMELLHRVVKDPEPLLLHLPFMLGRLNDSDIEKWKPFEERKDFVFIGFGGHAPNLDAVSYLKKEIWPMIRARLPEVNLNIFGGNLPRRVTEMHKPSEGFLVRGWAKDAQKVVSDAKVMLAPLRYGAGLKGKLIGAMRFGTPSITTTIGAEGMSKNLDWNGKICQEPKEFAKAAIRLYQNKEEWEQSRQNGIAILNTLYNSDELATLLRTKLEGIQQDLEKHRAQNFVGTMLQHQTMASTKYLAKWIEEKNRK